MELLYGVQIGLHIQEPYATIPDGRGDDMVTKTHAQGNKKVTLSLPVTLVEEVRRLVEDGVAPSQSAFVADAVEKEIHAWRVAQLREEFRQAAADPDFLQDIDETMRDFTTADDETARMIP
jgi:Arc/MetJ-type ribon-helix-helix transcriptional regulator